MTDQIVTPPPDAVADRREMLRELLRSRAAQAAEHQPASAGQRALWLFDRLHPGSPAYHLGGAARIEGAFDVPAMKAALTQVIRRHPVLRTTLAQVDGELRQRVSGEAGVEFDELDMVGCPAEWVDQVVAEFTQRPFDLARGPLLRAQVVRLDDDVHLLVLAAHHVATDLWSFGIIAGDLQRFYEAEVTGVPAVTEGPAAGYLDFVRWQSELLDGPAGRAAAAYWARRLQGEAPQLDLPLDRPRPARPAHRAASCGFTLDRELTLALKELARQAGTTPYVALLAVLNVLLHRYTGQRDIWIGSATSSRGRPAFHEIVGYFANIMVVRTGIEPGQTFRSLLDQVRETVLDGLEHQDYPFPLVIQQLAESRSDPGAPLFNVAFHYESSLSSAQRGLSLLGTGFTDAEIAVGDVVLKPYELEHHGSEHDLTLFAEEVDDTLYCSLRYATDLFDRQTVQDMAHHFRVLARECVRRPDAGLGTLSLLEPAERQRVLTAWNRPGDGVSTGLTCAHHLVIAQAERTPERVAVVCEERSLTYAELVAEARALASVLRARGVGPEVKVGLSADGSCDLVVGMLAVMIAGGAYIPLDPGYPPKRLEYMMEDSDVRLLLTQRHLAGRLPATGAPVLYLDDDHPAPDPAPEAVEPTADNLAYVIYTSGSTGRPKGVMVEHRGVVDLDLAHRQAFPPDPDRRILQNASISFDVSTWEWLMALGSGASLHLAPRAQLRPGPPLADVVRRRGITSLSATPSVMGILDPAGLPTVTELTSVGEAITAETVRAWAPGRRLVNAYGPTEITVFCTLERCEPDGGTPAIGRAVAGTELYVLDEYLEPVPVGVVGELYVGGTGVTRGYQNRPDLTADRFVPHPFSDRPGARLYRTGDRVRFGHDGRLHYLGRNDHQVKIRGVRTEPGEVQAQIVAHPAVREALVLARPARNGELRLIGYVVRHDGDTTSAAAVREHLEQRLMPNMVPAHLVLMDAFPLNPNGKVDRDRLPDPDETAAERPASGARPGTATERELAAVWEEVLGVVAAGIDDNFFELGGHSLLATRIVTRLHQLRGLELPLHEIFDAPTIRTLAARVDALAGAGAAPEPIERRPRGPEGLPLSFAQRRLWFMEQLRPGDQAYRLAGELHLEGPLDVGRLRAAMAAVLARHEVLRTVYRVAGGEPRQFVVEAAADPLPLVDLSGTPQADWDRVLSERMAAFDEEPFDLSAGPARAVLLRLADDHHVALLALHHIAGDGWSMRVLVEELAAGYAGRPLPEVPVQYADFACWQRDRQDSEDGVRALSSWERRLSGAPPALELPADRPHTGRPGRPRRVSRELGPTLTGAIGRLAAQESATPSMILLAAFQVLLSRWSGQDDVLVGLPVAGRLRTDLERAIGLFVNTVVIRTDTGGNPPFLDLLRQVRQSVLDADAHQEVPFEQIVERLAPDRDVSRTPIYQVVFNMINLDELVVDIPGIEARVTETEDVSPRFELTLYAKPHADGLTLDAVCDGDLYAAGTIAALLGQLESLLAQVVTDPARPIDDLTTPVPASEADSEGEPGVEPEGELGAEPGLGPGAERSALAHDRFFATAARHPGAEALHHDGTALTYEELAGRADALAEVLRRAGVGRGDRVAVHAARHPDLVVALLGVLRAGAAFAVIDRDHPRPRRAAAAAQLSAAAWLDATGATGPPEVLGPPVRLALAVADLPHRPARGPAFPVLRHTDTAYVAFTSGSTGRPKAVVGPHAPLAHFLAWYTATFQVSAADRFALASGLGHDPLLRDVFVPLSLGAGLHVPPPGHLADPAAFTAWLAGNRITVLHLTPPMARLLAGAPDGALPDLRYAFFGGDVLTEREVAVIRRIAPGAVPVNFYGATETPQAHAYHVVEDLVPGQGVPLGTGVRPARLLVLRGGREAGVGELGEIVVESPHLAAGYLDDPEATAERFHDGRYHTGDLGRLRADGTVSYAGRADRQVKVRGYRADPAEVESHLRQWCRDAHVTTQADASGETALIAYVVGADDPAGLRARLGGTLPAYLVPGRIVPVPELPLTANGKVDAAALAALAPDAPRETAGEPPAAGLEERLARLWCDLLGLERVGRDDNFFDLGGHSMLVVRLQALLREELGCELSVIDLFQSPTVAALAAAIERPPTGAAPSPEAGDEHDRKRAARRRRLKRGHHG
ncbi:amino acid adenylation domain-containing protein [Nonomuraea phyllanthi]|uniref:non-ribosomal peptide synthetase n=1 Tax=Nonomuraea phyllanthi TaxID=2219224 RepID=UPI00129361FA|nr:non-ribosomal peptide synthetase [Nonomuraea phyllanthi]QFY07531.1 amino acid adenylation domain-containing protein [Nonomuraea phyllanthi]